MAASSCGVIAALAGCSAGSRPTSSTASASGGTSPAVTATTSTGSTDAAGPVAPLTGLSVTAVTAQRPAVAVAGSDPSGLGSADVVFEEMASPVRYLAVFQSEQASGVGPVTSTRPTDGQLLSVLHPLTGYDGGTSSFVSTLDATKIVDVGYAGHASLYAAGSGGLTVSTAALAAGQSDGPPPGLLSYRPAGGSLASAQQTNPTSVRVEVPGQPAEQWSFDSRADRWVETAGGPRVSVANLVVQIVSFKTVYLSHRYGLTAQSPVAVGKGAVTVFSGTAAAGTWSKPGVAAVTNYFDAASEPMNFAPGPTWIALAPAGTRTSQAGG